MSKESEQLVESEQSYMQAMESLKEHFEGLPLSPEVVLSSQAITQRFLAESLHILAKRIVRYLDDERTEEKYSVTSKER